MLSDCCPVLSCLYVTLVYCGQTVGWIKIPLGTEVGLGQAALCYVRWAPSSSPMERGTATPSLSRLMDRRRQACIHINHSRCLLWPSGWMDQDTTWRGGRLRSRPHCIRWGPSSPSWKEGTAAPLHLSAHVYCGQAVAHLSNC